MFRFLGRLIAACFRTPKRALVSVIVIAAVGFLGNVGNASGAGTADLGAALTTPSSTQAPAAQTTAPTVELPDLVGLTGAEALAAATRAGLTESPRFIDDSTGAVVEDASDWRVSRQEPAAGSRSAKDGATHLYVNHYEAEAAASASAKAEADAAATAAAQQAAAEQAAAQQKAAEEAAAQQAAAEQAAAQQNQQQSASLVGNGSESSSSAYYGSCADARAAGAAPLYQGDPGYRGALDRDKDGIACE